MSVNVNAETGKQIILTLTCL